MRIICDTCRYINELPEDQKFLCKWRCQNCEELIDVPEKTYRRATKIEILSGCLIWIVVIFFAVKYYCKDTYNEYKKLIYEYCDRIQGEKE